MNEAKVDGMGLGEASTSPRPFRVHIGKKVPKKLYEEGWREVGGLSIHLGRGIWVLRLEKVAP